MAGCTDCGSSDISLCQCDDGKNSYTISTTNTTIANPMTILTSNIGQNTGKWALIGQPIFIEGYGTYQVTASTSTSITVAFPPSPFVGGAAYSLGSVDYDNAGTIPSGTKISPGGVKGTTGTAGVAATLEGVFHGATTTADINPASTAYLTLATENIAASSLIDVGDSLRIKACYYFYQDPSSTAIGNIKILFGGATLTEFSGIEPSMYDLFPYIEVECIVSRVDNVTVDVRTFLKWAGKGSTDYSSEQVTAGPTSHTYTTYQIIGATVSALTLATTVQLQGKVGKVDDRVKLGYYIIENLQKI